MPSATPSLQRARNLALQPQGWGIPPGTEDLLGSADSLLLPHGTNPYPYANTQQIYRKVCEWFVSWRPWQQKMLLCGITNKWVNNLKVPLFCVSTFDAVTWWGIILRSTVRTSDISWFSLPLLLQNGRTKTGHIRRGKCWSRLFCVFSVFQIDDDSKVPTE